MSEKLRIEKLAIKDIKLRTFIAEGNSRNDLAAHVYDVTYGLVRNNKDTIVIIDDSIVRGTTLKRKHTAHAQQAAPTQNCSCQFVAPGALPRLLRYRHVAHGRILRIPRSRKPAAQNRP